MIAQKGKAAAAASTAAAGETEAQILPMMAKAAVEGGGSVEYDKYGQMLAQVKKGSRRAPQQQQQSTPLPLLPPLPPPHDIPSFLPSLCHNTDGHCELQGRRVRLPPG